MAVERKFVHQGLDRARMDEYFSKQLDRAGYAGMEINRTPMGTQITIFAEKPGMVIGKGGKLVRRLTRDLNQFYNLDNPQIDVQNVSVPELNAQLMASRLASALERGWYFRKAAHSTLRRIIQSGAIGCRIVLSGKLTGPRSRIEKIVEGYIVHAGKPAEQIVQHGFATAVQKLGTIGCSIQIVLPDAVLPDVFNLVDVEPPEPVVEEETVEFHSETVVEEVSAEGIVETVTEETVQGVIIEEGAEITGKMAGEKSLPTDADVKTTSPEETTAKQPAISTKDIAKTPSPVETEPVLAGEEPPAITEPAITKHEETPITRESSPVETKGVPAGEAIPSTPEETSPVETKGSPADRTEVRNVDGIWEHKHGDLEWHVMAIVHKRLNEGD